MTQQVLSKFTAATFALILGLASAHADPSKPRIAVFTKSQSDPHFFFERTGADRAAASLGASTIHYVPTKPNNIAEQMSEMEDVIVKRPDAIIFMAVDRGALVPAVEKVNKAGIPIVNFNDRVGGGDFVSYVGADDHELGLQLARFLFGSLGGKGNVVIIEGLKGSTTSDERARGFQDAAKEFPGIRIVASQPANFQRLLGLQVMENLIQSHPGKIDGVLAASDGMGLGAIEALEAAGQTKTKIASINAIPEAIAAIKDGRLLASMDFNGFDMACVATEAAVKHLRGETVPKEIILKQELVTKDNFQKWDVAVEKRSCPKWEDVAR